LKVLGDSAVIAFAGESERRFAIVGDGAKVGSMSEKQFNDFQMAICGSGKEWRVAWAIAVVCAGSRFEQPFDDFGVTAGDGAGEGVVAGTVGGGSVDVRPLCGEIARDFEVAEDGGESDDRKTVRGNGTGDGRVFLHKLFDAIEIAYRSSFVELQCDAAREKEIADFATACVHAHENGRNAGIIFGGNERSLRVEQSGDGCGISDANGFEEFNGRHEGTSRECDDTQDLKSGATRQG
jgi:hypothetical protein